MWNESFPHALKEEKHEWVKSETTKQYLLPYIWIIPDALVLKEVLFRQYSNNSVVEVNR